MHQTKICLILKSWYFYLIFSVGCNLQFFNDCFQQSTKGVLLISELFRVCALQGLIIVKFIGQCQYLFCQKGKQQTEEKKSSVINR